MQRWEIETELQRKVTEQRAELFFMRFIACFLIASLFIVAIAWRNIC